MSDKSDSARYLDAQQLIFLPKWARLAIAALLALLALAACVSATVFLFFHESRDLIVPIMSIAQTAVGGFAIVLIVLFSEKQLSTHRLHEKTQEFLGIHVVDSLSRIELPQVEAGKTVQVTQVVREPGIYGSRKDIYGSNYILQLGNFRMQMWVGLNVKRLSAIYFVQADEQKSVKFMEDTFHFTFGGAQKVGYHTYFEHAVVKDENLVSIWSTVSSDNAILGNPAEQLFWVQDLAMMTQSVARTALRHGLNLNTKAEPGPL